MQWLVTGCSTGLGLDIARAALRSGQKCIATSRNPDSSPEAVQEIKRLGGVWAKLDVSNQMLESDVKTIVEDHGEVDVLVNNAGYADGGVLETMRYVHSLLSLCRVGLTLAAVSTLGAKYSKPTSGAPFVLVKHCCPL